MGNAYKISKYLKKIERCDGQVLLYHSLLGASIIIRKKLYRDIMEVGACSAIAIESDIYRYMKDNFFIVPNGYDEFEIIKEDIKERNRMAHTGYLFRQLQLIMSHSCNFRCSYCYEKDIGIEHKTTHQESSNSNMLFHIADKAVKEALKVTTKNNNHLFVEFFGGEPLVNWEIIKRILEKYENGNFVGNNISYSMTTNGSMLNKRIANVLKKYNVNVTVSLDSLQSPQRIYASGKAASKDILRNISMLSNNDNIITLNSTISKETINNFNHRELIDFAIDNNIRMIGLILDLDVNAYRDKNYQDKIVNTIIEAYNYGNSKGLPIVGYWFQIFSQIIGTQMLALASGYKTCPATGCKLSIEPNGDIFVCKGPFQKVGHIDNFDDTFTSPYYKSYLNALYKVEGNCRGCELEGFCSGVCMGSLEKRYRDISIIEHPACVIYRKIVKKLLESYESN